MQSESENLPANVEAERAILGGILLSDGQLYPEVAGKLSEQEFFLVSHRVIFALMGRMKGPIDLVTLSEELQRRNSLQSIGGPAYLSSLTNGIPRLANVDHYVGIVRERAALRKLAHTGEWIGSQAVSGEGSAEDMAAEAARQLAEIADAQAGGLLSFRDAYQAEFPSVDSIHEKWVLQKGLATGFRELDRLTGGLHNGELTLLAARPSLGKTSLAVNIASHIAKADKPVAIFSLEMSRGAIVFRIVCAEARVSSHRLQTGAASREERLRMVEAGTEALDWPIWMDDEMQRVETMLARAKALKAKHGLALVVVDYLQLMSSGKHESRVQEISYISRQMKGMAKELQVPVLALCQLNREPEERGGCPRLSDLRDSGQLEQDADTVIFLWKEQASGKHPSRGPATNEPHDKTVNVQVAKQRNGPIGGFKLVFEGRWTRFLNAAEDTGEQHSFQASDAGLPERCWDDSAVGKE